MKRILIISSYDLKQNTSGNIRLASLMQALHDCGCCVDCAYIPSEKKPDKLIENTLLLSVNQIFELKKCAKKNDTAQQVNSSVFYLVFPLIKRWLIKTYSRMSVYDVYKLRIKRLIKYEFGEYDCIISSSDPKSSHLLAERIIRTNNFKGKWIQYWGDPMTNDVSDSSFVPLFKKIEEHRLLKKCDLVIYTNPICQKYMMEKYADCSDKLKWIPTSNIKSANTVDEIESKSEYDVAYIGDYVSKYRNIKPLYDACNRLKLNTLFVGYSDINLEKTSFVNVLPRVSKAESYEIESKANVLIVLDNNVSGTKCVQVPGKLYQFALSNKFVLVISDNPELEKAYGHYGRFLFSKNDVESISNVLTLLKGVSVKSELNSPLNDFSQESIANLMDAYMR